VELAPAGVRHELGSPEWVRAVHRIVAELLEGEDLAGRTYSLSEEFTNPPPHLARAGTLGWHMRVADGRLLLGQGPLVDADRVNRADYASVLPLALLEIDGSSERLAELQERALALFQTGLIHSSGTPATQVFPRLAALHDRIARITRAAAEAGE